jgi:hypothetical protein
MNSADRARWLQPSATMPVDGDARSDPDPKDSAPDTDDALWEVLSAIAVSWRHAESPREEAGTASQRG